MLLCGAGRWGRNYARVLAASGLAFGVSDTDVKALKALRPLIGNAGWRTTSPLAEILAAPASHEQFDAVVIATPATTHYELALCAIEAGRHVLVEKPMAMDFRAAEHLVELARERGVKLQVGHLFELNPGVCTLHSWIKQGRLGRLEYLFSHQLSPGRVRQKEDVLLSLAPHDVSILLKLAGKPPVEVTAYGCEHAEPDVAGMAVVHMVFGQDTHVRAHAHVSWLHPEKVRRVVAVGSEAAAVLDDQAKSLLLYERLPGENPFPSSHIEQYDYASVEPLGVQLHAFKRYIGDGSEPVTTGRGALKVMAVLDAARRSLLSGSLATQVSYEQ